MSIETGNNPMTTHFTRPLTEASLEPVTYDSPHTVTLSLSDWLNIQTYLSFYANNCMDKGEGYWATAEKVRGLLSHMSEQTDIPLSAAADAEDVS
jgi:hypothetical protein